MSQTFLYLRRKIFDLSMAKRKMIKEQLPCLSHKKYSFANSRGGGNKIFIISS